MKVMMVALMGFCGALLRYILSESWGTIGGFPVTTLLINVAGCIALGWFYTVSVHRLYVHPLLRLGIGTGFIGAFTTFSTFVVETWKLMDAGLHGLAGVYILVTIVLGIVATWFGMSIGNSQSNMRLRAQTRG